MPARLLALVAVVALAFAVAYATVVLTTERPPPPTTVVTTTLCDAWGGRVTITSGPWPTRVDLAADEECARRAGRAQPPVTNGGASPVQTDDRGDRA